jgi:uncharacterized protein (DUF58 family)
LALLRVAEWLAQAHPEGLPSVGPTQKRAAAVIISDFLEPLDDVRKAVTAIAAAGVRGHLVQVADPAEESLPYDGRIEFHGLGSPVKYLAKKTESLREDYKQAYQAHREGLRQLARSLGWSFTLHRTDQPVAQTLLPLHMLVSGAADRRASA